MESDDHSARIRTTLRELIGKDYDILQSIGRGGMGEVYLAQNLRTGGRCAIKVLLEDLAGNEILARRFLQEARIVSHLGSHPNIVHVWDVNSSVEKRLHWLVMDYVEGEDLSEYLDRLKLLTVPEAVCIARGVAEALGHAARHGIVHRDIKPSNIRIDTNGMVRVLDFGIARAVDEPSGLTRPNLGTKGYMCPEQIQGIETTPRCDLYALGLVLQEMLSGPFNGSGTYERRTIGIEDTERDPAVESILKRLLQFKPEDRYATAEELIVDLDAVARHYSPVRLRPAVDTRPPGPPDIRGTRPRRRTWRWNPRRWKWSWVAAASAALVIAPVGLILISHLSPPAPTFKDAHGLMYLVPAGKFIFGDDSDESPYKRMERSLPAFYIDATETSNAQYATFVTETGRRPPEYPDFRTATNLPVGDLSFYDAQAYCSWAGRRLPTEEEWEKAARGPKGNKYSWGNDPISVPDSLIPVNAHPEWRSWVGALNLSGNVFEWTSSSFPVTPEVIDDMNKKTGRHVADHWKVIKGGSFLVKDHGDLFLRAYSRRGWPVDQPARVIGFRCVKDVK